MTKELNLYDELMDYNEISELVYNGIDLYVSCHQNPTKAIVPKVDLGPTVCRMQESILKDKYLLDSKSGRVSMSIMRALLGKHLMLFDEDGNKLGNLNKYIGKINRPSVNLFENKETCQRAYDEQLEYIVEMSNEISDLFLKMNQLKVK